MVHGIICRRRDKPEKFGLGINRELPGTINR
jgi:hypothetical protein